MELDETHRQLIALLRTDARISMASLAEQVGISRANAYARVAALMEAGVIEGFHAQLNAKLIGKPLAALVFVSLWQSQWHDFRLRLAHLPELEYFAVTTGEYDAMLLVRSDSVDGIHALVVNEIAQWPSTRSTETVFLMDERKFDYSLEPMNRRVESHEGDYGASKFVRAPRSRKGSHR